LPATQPTSTASAATTNLMVGGWPEPTSGCGGGDVLGLWTVLGVGIGSGVGIEVKRSG